MPRSISEVLLFSLSGHFIASPHLKAFRFPLAFFIKLEDKVGFAKFSLQAKSLPSSIQQCSFAIPLRKDLDFSCHFQSNMEFISISRIPLNKPISTCCNVENH